MFKPIKFSLLIGALILLFAACNSSNAQKSNSTPTDIQSIIYTYSAGRTGQTRIEISPNWLKTEMVSVRFNDLDDIERKISQEEWSALVSSINLKTVEKTKNGSMEGYADKPEEVFEFVTKEATLKIENADQNSSEYKQLQKLKNLLYSLIKAKK